MFYTFLANCGTFMYHETNFGIAQEYVICNHLRYLSKWGMVCVFLGGVCLNVGCQVSSYYLLTCFYTFSCIHVGDWCSERQEEESPARDEGGGEGGGEASQEETEAGARQGEATAWPGGMEPKFSKVD